MLKERMARGLRSTNGADRRGSELLHYWRVVSEVSVFLLFNVFENSLLCYSRNGNIVKYFNLKLK